MFPPLLCLVGLIITPILCQEDIDFRAAAESISAEMNSPSFVPYSKPKQEITEFIALGDSYTAGTGCNGDKETFGGGANRGERSYPMQMAVDTTHWRSINGAEDLPRLSFHAYTGDKSNTFVEGQLKMGDYSDDKKKARDQPFGKPQIAVMTIGGNDAHLSKSVILLSRSLQSIALCIMYRYISETYTDSGNRILNSCVYRAWKPLDCQEVLSSLQKEIDDGLLRLKMNYALYRAAHAGRQAGGANPRESFQVYALEYINFFNDENPECDKISWGFWPWSLVPLTTQLRKQLNQMTLKVNQELRKAAEDLAPMGVVFIDGINEQYEGHRYCEKDHTSQEMTHSETWFWSRFASTKSSSEGPANPDDGDELIRNADLQNQMLNFIFPDKNYSIAQVSLDSPPWIWEGADKYPTYEDLLAALAETTANPFIKLNLLRSFHPKGTAYTSHASQFFEAVKDNREYYHRYMDRCRDVSFPILCTS